MGVVWYDINCGLPDTKRRVLIKRVKTGHKMSPITEGWHSKGLDCWFNKYGQTLDRSRIIAWAEMSK